jgi:hypothetical protein
VKFYRAISFDSLQSFRFVFVLHPRRVATVDIDCYPRCVTLSPLRCPTPEIADTEAPASNLTRHGSDLCLYHLARSYIAPPINALMRWIDSACAHFKCQLVKIPVESNLLGKSSLAHESSKLQLVRPDLAQRIWVSSCVFGYSRTVSSARARNLPDNKISKVRRFKIQLATHKASSNVCHY